MSISVQISDIYEPTDDGKSDQVQAVAPINDRRRSGVTNFLRKGEEAGDQWMIAAETGPLSGLSYAIHGSLMLGRSLDCDLAIVTPHVSRQHAHTALGRRVGCDRVARQFTLQ